MEIILDAEVIISGEKSIFNLPGWLGPRADDRFEAAAITIAELWHGVERASAVHRATRQKYLEALVAVAADHRLYGRDCVLLCTP